MNKKVTTVKLSYETGKGVYLTIRTANSDGCIILGADMDKRGIYLLEEMTRYSPKVCKEWEDVIAPIAESLARAFDEGGKERAYDLLCTHLATR